MRCRPPALTPYRIKTWVSDPDGNEWEVFVVLEDNLPEASGTDSSACCTSTRRANTMKKRVLILYTGNSARIVLSSEFKLYL
jgi:hypothetical protein